MRERETILEVVIEELYSDMYGGDGEGGDGEGKGGGGSGGGGSDAKELGFSLPLCIVFGRAAGEAFSLFRRKLMDVMGPDRGRRNGSLISGETQIRDELDNVTKPGGDQLIKGSKDSDWEEEIRALMEEPLIVPGGKDMQAASYKATEGRLLAAARKLSTPLPGGKTMRKYAAQLLARKGFLNFFHTVLPLMYDLSGITDTPAAMFTAQIDAALIAHYQVTTILVETD